MHLNFYGICAAGLALTALLPGPAWAQGTAALRGVVADSASGRPLGGVSVQVLDRPGGAVADELGQFRLGNLPAGTYVVRATGLGFAARQQTVVLQAGQTAAVALRLPTASLTLAEVTVAQPRDPNQSLAVISNIDKLLRPVNSAQDLLPLVPGLMIAQHAGGGKAEQIFVRGFDADHGTDFNVSIDGLPVNMVSHAHGQGYADFHFVIPETVDQLRVYKGPYTARFGDFATAGAGEFTTKTRLDRSQVKLEVGQFDTRRAVALVNLLPVRGAGQRPAAAYVAGEYQFTNSYFDSPAALPALQRAGQVHRPAFRPHRPDGAGLAVRLALGRLGSDSGAGRARRQHLALRQYRPHRGRLHRPHQRHGRAHHRPAP